MINLEAAKDILSDILIDMGNRIRKSRLKYKTLIGNAAKCKLCGKILESYCRYDFKSCNCGNLSVDDLDYIKRSAKHSDKVIETPVWNVK